MPARPPEIPVAQMMSQILGLLQSRRNPSREDAIKMHPVEITNEKGKKVTVAKTLPQILVHLDESIQDLTDVVEELTEEMVEPEPPRRRKKGKRSNRIRAKKE